MAVQPLSYNTCPWNKSILRFTSELPSILPLSAGSKAGTITSAQTELRVFKKDKQYIIHGESNPAQPLSCSWTSNRLKPPVLQCGEIRNPASSWCEKCWYAADFSINYIKLPVFTQFPKLCEHFFQPSALCNIPPSQQTAVFYHQSCSFWHFLLSLGKCCTGLRLIKTTMCFQCESQTRLVSATWYFFISRYLHWEYKSGSVKGSSGL